MNFQRKLNSEQRTIVKWCNDLQWLQCRQTCRGSMHFKQPTSQFLLPCRNFTQDWTRTIEGANTRLEKWWLFQLNHNTLAGKCAKITLPLFCDLETSKGDVVLGLAREHRPNLLSEYEIPREVTSRWEQSRNISNDPVSAGGCLCAYRRCEDVRCNLSHKTIKCVRNNQRNRQSRQINFCYLIRSLNK